MVVFDTSILIDAMSGVGRAVAAIESYKGKEDAWITVVTKYELLRSRRGIDAQTAELLVESMNVYYLKDAEMRKSVEIYNALRANGTPINELDVLIAGIALANNQTLVTSDRDFEKVKLQGVRVV